MIVRVGANGLLLRLRLLVLVVVMMMMMILIGPSEGLEVARRSPTPRQVDESHPLDHHSFTANQTTPITNNKNADQKRRLNDPGPAFPPSPPSPPNPNPNFTSPPSSPSPYPPSPSPPSPYPPSPSPPSPTPPSPTPPSAAPPATGIIWVKPWFYPIYVPTPVYVPTPYYVIMAPP